MKLLRFSSCLLAVAALALPLSAQTLYVPSGTIGIGSSSNGNVGIGVSNPLGRLHANGDIRFGVGYGALSEVASNAATILGNNVIAGVGANTVKRYFDDPGYGTYLKINNVGLTFHNISSQSYATEVSYDTSELFRITSGGNVGIGTSAPRSRLDLGSSVGAGKGFRVGDYFELNEQESYNNAISIGFNASVAADNGTFAPAYAPGSGLVMAMEGGGSGNLDFYGHNWAGSSSPVALTAFTHIIRFATNGNVGIGTTSPSHKLAVNGTMRAKEVIVDTGWSDYVFAKDYRLASLSEVERAIEKDGHLPGIPSAQEVAEHGVSMGDMQSKLLAKIEELTLYMIEMKKENTALRKEMDALKHTTK